MKRMLAIFLIIISNRCAAQETEFKFTQDGFTDFVVTECPNKSKEELYKRTLDWIAVTFNTPKEVIKGQIPDEYIRIEGAAATKLISTGTKYQIEISFKDGKYKFDIIEILFYSEYDPIETGWKKFDITNVKKYYNRDGQLKNRARKNWERVIKYFNDLNTNLKTFILSPQIPSNKNNW